ncbi:MAG: hypothetical protein ABSC48_07330 [Terracidiphilus sp.]
MHIHGNSMAVNAANFYAAAQNEKTAAAQRAAEVRRKLLKGASEIESSGTAEESLMIGQWMDSRHSQVESQDAYCTAASGKDLDFG